jgi:hypothetical protein
MDHVEEGRTAVGRAGSFNPEEPRPSSSRFRSYGRDLHYGKNSYIRTLERRVLERVPLTAAPVCVCERKVAPVTSVTEIEKNTGILRMHSQIKISVAAPRTLLG